jgi:SnoaL-like domain
MDMRTRTIEVNDQTYAACNAHDPDAVAAVFADDAVTRDAGSDEVAVGRDAVLERAVRLLAAFPGLQLERQDLCFRTVAWYPSWSSMTQIWVASYVARSGRA